MSALCIKTLYMSLPPFLWSTLTTTASVHHGPLMSSPGGTSAHKRFVFKMQMGASGHCKAAMCVQQQARVD